jgi:hypothetical protein
VTGVIQPQLDPKFYKFKNFKIRNGTPVTKHRINIQEKRMLCSEADRVVNGNTAIALCSTKLKSGSAISKIFKVERRN